MALTQVKTDGIANGAVTTQQLAPGAAGGPKVTQIQITNSGGTVLDDTAISLSGGYIKITGTGFAAGAQVIVNNTPATSTTFVSTTVLNAQVGAQSAGTYVVYVINTDGGVAIAVNGLTYSSEPVWVTGSTLPAGASDTPISIQLSASEATTYTLQAGSTLPTGLTLTSGGLLSGTVSNVNETTYTFTVVAIDAQLQDSPRTFSITIQVGDPYFYLTTLLLPGNGTNNGTNNTFLDSSNNNFTITRYGNTTQGTSSPFSQTGWSVNFGSANYLTTASNAAFGFGTGDFTVEAWVYPTSAYTTYNYIYTTAITSGLTLYVTASTLKVRAYGDTDILSSATIPALNTWTHVAATRSGTTLRIFVNGTLTATGTSSYNFATGSAAIGNDTTNVAPWLGFISNLRIVKGTALYTSSFTPSTTPLTAVAGTSLLTCQSNRFIDNSSNAFAITVNGSPSIQSASPFNPSVTYTANAIGGSAYFDGTGDYLSYPADSSFWNDTSFTMEFWAFCTKASGSATVLASWTDANFSAGSWGAEVNTGSTFTLSNGGSSTTNQGPWMQGTTLVRNNGWHHFCVTKSAGNVYRLFTDGKFEAYRNESFTTTNNVSIKVGYQGDGTYQPESRIYSGWISGIRIIRNSVPAEYQTSLTTPGTQVFTPPTAPPTNVAGTTILMNFTNGQITDATSKNDLETVGDAKISTTQSKWGGSSMYFDGTGDWLKIPKTALLDFGTGDFTVETWVRFNTVGIDQAILAGDGTTGSYDILYRTGIGLVIGRYNTAFDNTFAWSPSINTWYHIVWCRSGSSLRAFVDGVQIGTTVSNSLAYNGGAVYNSIGTSDNGTNRLLNGYLDDLRVTKGYARYTSNFTPPTSAFTLK